MYTKLSMRNVRRSFKDYAVYFLTIIVAVSLFYIFNALSQKDVLGKILSSDTSEMANVINLGITILSVFVAIVLGFLIIYANNYLIRRRKKEIGIYLTLGMSKKKVAGILLIETCAIGTVSLVIGIVIGVFLSQGFAALVERLALGTLGTSIDFIFSVSACVKTVVYFAVMFLFVMIFNSYVVGKYSVINLIHGDRQNQKFKVLPMFVYFVVFGLSLVLIGRGYWLIHKYGLGVVSTQFLYAFLFGSVGTILFFFSLAGFSLKIAQMNQRFYYKRLNMFVLRQVSSKMNTAWVSISIVTLLLFISISALSIGINVSGSINQSISEFAPYDVTIRDKTYARSLEQELEQKGIHFAKYTKKIHRLTLYNSGVSFSDVAPYINQNKRSALLRLSSGRYSLPAIGLSEFNQLLKLQGKEIRHLDQQEGLLFTPDRALPEQMKKIDQLTINGESTQILRGIMPITIENSMGSAYAMGIVLPDDVVNHLKPVRSIINFNYDGNVKAQSKLFNQRVKALVGPSDNAIVVAKTFIEDHVFGTTILLVFTILYIGLIFLIAGCAILALQQLADSSDNVSRYGTLRKLGANKKMINRALMSQIAIYFLIPLLVALIHGFVPLKAMGDQNQVIGSANSIWQTAAVVVPILLIIYLAYFMVTYLNSKSIVNKKPRSE